MFYKHSISCLHENNESQLYVYVLHLKLKRSRVEHEALNCLNVLTWNLCPVYHLGTLFMYKVPDCFPFHDCTVQKSSILIKHEYDATKGIK